MSTTTEKETRPGGDSKIASTPGYPIAVELVPDLVLDEGPYRLRFARRRSELDAVLRLRFEVFNVELGEGLDESWKTGLDRDPFDAVCHHLLVTDRRSEEIVGTYRAQVATMARENLGWYSSLEFTLDALPENLVERSVEVGRACVAVEHRNKQVLFLLWRGLAAYMEANDLRYLFGCCSLTSQDPAEGKAMWEHLEAQGHLHPSLRIDPRPDLACWDDPDEITARPGPVEVPKLFRTYLRHGAKVLGPPAIDREFKTIDFLILLDVETFDERRRRTFFGAAPIRDLPLVPGDPP